MKLVLFDRPIACSPSGATASAVAIDAIDSAIDAYTPPWTSPAGCLSSSRTGTRALTSVSDSDTNTRPYRRSKPNGASLICETVAVAISAPR